MAMADWIDHYPQVKALLQEDGDVLRYAPDGPDPETDGAAVEDFHTAWDIAAAGSCTVVAASDNDLADALALSLATLTNLAGEIRAHEQTGLWGPCGHPLVLPAGSTCRFCGQSLY